MRLDVLMDALAACENELLALGPPDEPSPSVCELCRRSLVAIPASEEADHLCPLRPLGDKLPITEDSPGPRMLEGRLETDTRSRGFRGTLGDLDIAGERAGDFAAGEVVCQPSKLVWFFSFNSQPLFIFSICWSFMITEKAIPRNKRTEKLGRRAHSVCICS
mmetsp:Transcript_6476/g.10251  ORF Transcript_6476/g.10251 Transcript_6476/m.10251 type:complete len:162 (-) Transcript_6476:1126-1611(-)